MTGRRDPGGDERYVAEHPDATYDEVEAACFPGRDGELALFAISPRHLEACATRTGQILVEGGLQRRARARPALPAGARRPSDLGQVLEEARDESRRRELTEAAYRDIVASGRYTYRGFVEHVDRVLLAGAPRRRSLPVKAALAAAAVAARAHDRIAWLRVARRLRGLPLPRPRRRVR